MSEEIPPGHTLDEDGEHDPDGCYSCLLTREVKTVCRCAECCRTLIIEVLNEDAEREPKIKELGSPLKGIDDEPDGYLLNTGANHACVFLDQQTNLCTIHDTRPLVCRLFNCDGQDREELVQLGILSPRE